MKWQSPQTILVSDSKIKDWDKRKSCEQKKWSLGTSRQVFRIEENGHLKTRWTLCLRKPRIIANVLKHQWIDWRKAVAGSLRERVIRNLRWGSRPYMLTMCRNAIFQEHTQLTAESGTADTYACWFAGEWIMVQGLSICRDYEGRARKWGKGKIRGGFSSFSAVRVKTVKLIKWIEV